MLVFCRTAKWPRKHKCRKTAVYWLIYWIKYLRPLFGLSLFTVHGSFQLDRFSRIHILVVNRWMAEMLLIAKNHTIYGIRNSIQLTYQWKLDKRKKKRCSRKVWRAFWALKWLSFHTIFDNWFKRIFYDRIMNWSTLKVRRASITLLFQTMWLALDSSNFRIFITFIYGQQHSIWITTKLSLVYIVTLIFAYSIYLFEFDAAIRSTITFASEFLPQQHLKKKVAIAFNSQQ